MLTTLWSFGIDIEAVLAYQLLPRKWQISSLLGDIPWNTRFAAF